MKRGLKGNFLDDTYSILCANKRNLAHEIDSFLVHTPIHEIDMIRNGKIFRLTIGGTSVVHFFGLHITISAKVSNSSHKSTKVTVAKLHISSKAIATLKIIDDAQNTNHALTYSHLLPKANGYARLRDMLCEFIEECLVDHYLKRR